MISKQMLSSKIDQNLDVISKGHGLGNGLGVLHNGITYLPFCNGKKSSHGMGHRPKQKAQGELETGHPTIHLAKHCGPVRQNGRMIQLNG